MSVGLKATVENYSLLQPQSCIEMVWTSALCHRDRNVFDFAGVLQHILHVLFYWSTSAYDIYCY